MEKYKIERSINFLGSPIAEIYELDVSGVFYIFKKSLTRFNCIRLGLDFTSDESIKNHLITI